MTEGGLRAHLEAARRLPAGYFWHRHRYALALSAVPAGATELLDWGCGEGGFARALLAHGPRGARVRVWDPEPLAREALAPELAAGRALWADPAALAGTQGFVSALDVLEHCEDDAAEARRLAALLAPGGVLFAAVPAFSRLWSGWDEALGHRRRYDDGALEALLAGAGLRVRRSSCFFSYLYPAALRRAGRPASGVEFPSVAAPVHAALVALGAAERAWLKLGSLPVGSSRFAIAEKPA